MEGQSGEQRAPSATPAEGEGRPTPTAKEIEKAEDAVATAANAEEKAGALKKFQDMVALVPPDQRTQVLAEIRQINAAGHERQRVSLSPDGSFVIDAFDYERKDSQPRARPPELGSERAQANQSVPQGSEQNRRNDSTREVGRNSQPGDRTVGPTDHQGNIGDVSDPGTSSNRTRSEMTGADEITDRHAQDSVLHKVSVIPRRVFEINPVLASSIEANAKSDGKGGAIFRNEEQKYTLEAKADGSIKVTYDNGKVMSVSRKDGAEVTEVSGVPEPQGNYTMERLVKVTRELTNYTHYEWPNGSRKVEYPNKSGSVFNIEGRGSRNHHWSPDFPEFDTGPPIGESGVFDTRGTYPGIQADLTLRSHAQMARDSRDFVVQIAQRVRDASK